MGKIESPTSATVLPVPADEKKPTLQPFHGARLMAFLLAVVMAYAGYRLSQHLLPWVEPDYLLPGLLIGFVFICCCAEAWAQARKPDSGTHPLTRVPYTFAMLVAYAILVGLVGCVIGPNSEPPVAYMRASELRPVANMAIAAMRERYAANTPISEIGLGVIVNEVGMVSAAAVSQSGVITLRNDKYRLKMVLTPHLEEKPGERPDITWRCTGEPRRMMPKTCR